MTLESTVLHSMPLLILSVNLISTKDYIDAEYLKI